MKLAVITQAVDTKDPALGFFVRWIEELARRFDRVEVICLRKGGYSLPSNVRVYSLGKERGPASRAVYALRFLLFVWRLRREYDAAFVHMNQEYILLAGWLWKLLGKRIYMWRNHYQGSWLTDIAAAFCVKVFCTSKHSYTAKYAKTVIMPVGVDTERFNADPRVERKPNSILFLARMAPSKRPELLLGALGFLKEKGVNFTTTFCGSPLPKDETYYETLRAKVEGLGIGNRVAWMPALTNDRTPDLYRAHEIFVNCSPSGMFDKTLFEAAASGCYVLAASEDWRELAGARAWFSPDPRSLADAIQEVLAEPNDRLTKEPFASVAHLHNLDVLAERIRRELE